MCGSAHVYLATQLWSRLFVGVCVWWSVLRLAWRKGGGGAAPRSLESRRWLAVCEPSNKAYTPGWQLACPAHAVALKAGVIHATSGGLRI